jgi:ACS family tartrate transporter-like MFS transporter
LAASLFTCGGLKGPILGVGTVWALVGISIAAMLLRDPVNDPNRNRRGVPHCLDQFGHSVGNLGGFFGPTMVGWAKDYTGSFAGGLYALAGFALLSAMVSALGLRIPHPAAEQMASVPAE